MDSPSYTNFYLPRHILPVSPQVQQMLYPKANIFIQPPMPFIVMPNNHFPRENLALSSALKPPKDKNYCQPFVKRPQLLPAIEISNPHNLHPQTKAIHHMPNSICQSQIPFISFNHLTEPEKLKFSHDIQQHSQKVFNPTTIKNAQSLPASQASSVQMLQLQHKLASQIPNSISQNQIPYTQYNSCYSTGPPPTSILTTVCLPGATSITDRFPRISELLIDKPNLNSSDAIQNEITTSYNSWLGLLKKQAKEKEQFRHHLVSKIKNKMEKMDQLKIGIGDQPLEIGRPNKSFVTHKPMIRKRCHARTPNLKEKVGLKSLTQHQIQSISNTNIKNSRTDHSELIVIDDEAPELTPEVAQICSWQSTLSNNTFSDEHCNSVMVNNQMFVPEQNMYRSMPLFPSSIVNQMMDEILKVTPI